MKLTVEQMADLKNGTAPITKRHTYAKGDAVLSKKTAHSAEFEGEIVRVVETTSSVAYHVRDAAGQTWHRERYDLKLIKAAS